MKNSKNKAIEKKKEELTSYHKDVLRDAWGSGKSFVHEGKKYLLGRMSYGDYYLEPFNKKHPEGRGERDNGGHHRSDVKWQREHPTKKDHFTFE